MQRGGGFTSTPVRNAATFQMKTQSTRWFISQDKGRKRGDGSTRSGPLVSTDFSYIILLHVSEARSGQSTDPLRCPPPAGPHRARLHPFERLHSYIQCFSNQRLTLAHSCTHSPPDGGSAPRGDRQLVGSRQGDGVSQGHASTLSEEGDRTSNLPATSHPALPPEPHAAQESR